MSQSTLHDPGLYPLWSACLGTLTFDAYRRAKYVGDDAHVHRTLEYAEAAIVQFGESEARQPAAIPAPAANQPINGYDYKNQAWVVNGRYYPCGHAGTEWPCDCFGRKHSGELVREDAEVN